jgi:CpXC protein
MSLFTPNEIVCPHCGQTSAHDVFDSVNADRRPDLRAAILDQSFQRIECPHCKGSFRIEPQMNYIDVERGQWLAAFQRDRIEQWRALEGVAMEGFNRAYGPASSAAEQELGASLKARVVFGWDAVREKLLAFDADIDDVALEQLKLMLQREMQEPPLPLGAELRLTEVLPDSAELTFAVQDRKGEVLEELTVPRDLLDDIVADPSGWESLRAQLTAGPFVDGLRMSRGVQA